MEVALNESGFRSGQARGGLTVGASIEDMERALDALPDAKLGGPRFRHTKESDDLLLKHWPRANKRSVAKALGMSTNVARDRYLELTKEQP